jgi:hypothetical protein
MFREVLWLTISYPSGEIPPYRRWGQLRRFAESHFEDATAHLEHVFQRTPGPAEDSLRVSITHQADEGTMLNLTDLVEKIARCWDLLPEDVELHDDDFTGPPRWLVSP